MLDDIERGNGRGQLRSVHITNSYHKQSGGISTSYNNLLTAAAKRKRHLSLIVPGETESVEVLSEYTKIYYVPAKKSPIFDKRYRVIMPWQYMASGSLVRKILLEERPDIIEVTDKYTLSMIGPLIRWGKNMMNRAYAAVGLCLCISHANAWMTMLRHSSRAADLENLFLVF